MTFTRPERRCLDVIGICRQEILEGAGLVSDLSDLIQGELWTVKGRRGADADERMEEVMNIVLEGAGRIVPIGHEPSPFKDLIRFSWWNKDPEGAVEFLDELEREILRQVESR